MSITRYNIDNGPILHLNTRLNYITSSQYGRDWNSVIHAHHFTELFYITSGIGCFIIDGKTTSVGKDDLIIVNPYIEHTEVSKDVNPLQYIALGIEGLSFVSGQLSEMNNAVLNLAACRDEILAFFNAMLSEVKEKNETFEIACQNLLELFIIYLKRRTSYSLAITSNDKMQKECAYIKQYIDSNFSEDITLDFLAELAHVNKYYLSHSFTRYLGVSPINYLINRRIEESKYYLQTTNYSILHISSIIGFSSLSYFSQSFKKNTGQSPNAYRRTYSQQKEDAVSNVQE